jgi:hypothetical protein
MGMAGRFAVVRLPFREANDPRPSTAAFENGVALSAFHIVLHGVLLN